MSLLRQGLLSLVILAGALFVWVSYVPSAIPFLDRIGVISMLGLNAADLQKAASEQGQRRGGGPVQVIVSQVRDQMIADEVNSIGDGRALHNVTARSEAVGRITAIAVVAGSRVEAGDLMISLENEAESIAMERAQVTLEDAQAEAQRVEQLKLSGAVTEVRAREAELALRTAELSLRQARFDLGQRRVVAPISGMVGIIDLEVGDRVGVQDALVSITDRSQVLIDFRVPERVIGQMSIGMPISVTPLGLRDVTLTGEISAIDTVVDRASRTLRVQGKVANKEDNLRAGMAFSVLMTFPGETLLAVDPLSLQWSSDGAFVWAVRDGKAARVPVDIRQRNSDTVLVEAELTPGETIVIEGVQNLRPGSEVLVSEKVSALLTVEPVMHF